MKHSFTALVLALLLAATGAYAQSGEGMPSYVSIQTSQGDILIELDSASAPKSVENFLAYVREGAYNGTIFHRVVGDFVVQGGCFTPDFEQRHTHSPIPTEATNGLLNKRGTIAMARSKDQDSATNQFFINLSDNIHLNHHAPTPGYWGYAVFGKVVQGMDVVDRIGQSVTGKGGPFPTDVPQSPIVITQAGIVPPSAMMTAQIEAEKDVPVDTKKSKRNADAQANKNK